MTTHKQISLSAAVALISSLATALAMAAYAIMQYLSNPNLGIAELVVRHGWHVVALGGLIYLLLYATLNVKLVKLMDEFYFRLYAVKKGDYRPITHRSRIKEIQKIIDEINILIEEVKKSKGEQENVTNTANDTSS